MSPPQQVDPQEVLLLELHHRFYNSLQVISSLAGRLTHADVPAETARRTACELQDMIGVLARLHRLLAEPCGVDLRRSCETLCCILASAYGRTDGSVRLLLPADPMSAGMCRGFMLMLAELVTNAFKHAPAGMPFDLEVVLKATDEGYDLAVSSPGPVVACGRADAPRVASQLAARMGGTLTANTRDGYTVHVSIPVP